MRFNGRLIAVLMAIVALVAVDTECYGQTDRPRSRRENKKNPEPQKPQEVKRYQIVGGVLTEVTSRVERDTTAHDPEVSRILGDSLMVTSHALRDSAEIFINNADSLISLDPANSVIYDSLRLRASQYTHLSDSLATEAERLFTITPPPTDSLAMAADTMAVDSLVAEELSPRELRRQERERIKADTSFVRYSPIFRDTMPISRMTAISLVAPGFGQLHNKQYWKIPVLYGSVGTLAYFGIQNNKCFKKAKNHYDARIALGYDRETTDLDKVQSTMIKYNTRRQLFFGAAAAAYIYFVCDGVMNHPGGNTRIKVATTLSTILPGAGQFYNGSYWKVPIVMGSFATMAYMVDWNNRAYQRYKRAFDFMEAGNTDAIEAGLRGQSRENLLNYRKSARRNRDLCIILTGAVYLINLIDAHVEAHMKDYDISDDLNVTLMPAMSSVSTATKGTSNTMGFSLNFNF